MKTDMIMPTMAKCLPLISTELLPIMTRAIIPITRLTIAVTPLVQNPVKLKKSEVIASLDTFGFCSATFFSASVIDLPLEQVCFHHTILTIARHHQNDDIPF
jgi:hypothetical protein